MASFSVIELVTAAHCFETIFILYSFVSPDSVFKYSAIEQHIFLIFFTWAEKCLGTSQWIQDENLKAAEKHISAEIFKENLHTSVKILQICTLL